MRCAKVSQATNYLLSGLVPKSLRLLPVHLWESCNPWLLQNSHILRSQGIEINELKDTKILDGSPHLQLFPSNIAATCSPQIPVYHLFELRAFVCTRNHCLYDPFMHCWKRSLPDLSCQRIIIFNMPEQQIFVADEFQWRIHQRQAHLTYSIQYMLFHKRVFHSLTIYKIWEHSKGKWFRTKRNSDNNCENHMVKQNLC